MSEEPSSSRLPLTSSCEYRCLVLSADCVKDIYIMVLSVRFNLQPKSYQYVFTTSINCVLYCTNRTLINYVQQTGFFSLKNKTKLKTKIKMPNGWRTINSLVHKIRLHRRRGKGMAESFSRQKSRHAPQKEGGLKILCDLPLV